MVHLTKSKEVDARRETGDEFRKITREHIIGRDRILLWVRRE